MKRKAFVGVKSQYHKRKVAIAVLDHAHALRQGFTRSQNVYEKYAKNNAGYYFHGANSCAEALDLMCLKHKQITGKKVRSDSNILFEHVVWLSEHHYTKLENQYGQERVKKAVVERLKQYAMLVKKEFGFEPLGVDLHLDEGRYENNQFIRNIHAHVQFINYSFEKRVAPLRHMMKKGKDINGRTNNLNPNFERLQDLAYFPFKNLGFHRGNSKNITNRVHLKKEDFVKNKLTTKAKNLMNISQKESKIIRSIENNRSVDKRLSVEIEQKKAKLSQLSSQIEQLHEMKKSLSIALTKRSKTALRKAAHKISNSTFPPRQHI